jgi:N4-gp56 family major capsid protein
MNEYEVIQNAIDANGFVTTAASGSLVNPTYWNHQLLAFLEARLAIADKAKVYDDILGQDGASFKVTIDAAPTAAASVAETADVTVTAYETVTQVTFTPTEYAKAYSLSDKEARRSFFSAMDNMTRKLAYALALNRDNAAVTLLTATTNPSVIVNSVAFTALASSDTLDYNTIVNAVTTIRAAKMIPRYLFVSPAGLGQLSKLSQFVQVQQAGSDQTLREGLIGRIYGLDVYWTTQIAPSSNKTKAIVLGVDQMGDPTFGIGRKALPTVRTQRFELGRYTNVVAVEEWDMEMLRTAGVCLVCHYE